MLRNYYHKDRFYPPALWLTLIVMVFFFTADPLFSETIEQRQAKKDHISKGIKKYKINIYSCRCSPHWSELFSDHDPEKQKAFIEKYMNEHELPYDKVEIRDKPVGLHIGDECREYTGHNWRELTKRLLSI